MKIKINGYRYKVKFVDGSIKKMNPDEDHYNLGLTEQLEGVINIRKGMNGQIIRSTVIHELVHAFIFAFGYTVEGEEAMCDFFGAQGDEIMRIADMIMREGKSRC